MKNPSGHSITSEIKKRVPLFVSMLILAGMIALNAAVPAPEPEADSVHPMANASVSWEQTYHAGAWGDGQ